MQSSEAEHFSPHSSSLTSEAQLRQILDHAGHYLPAQGPIGVFVHHNTLHAFQHLPFEEAVSEAGRIFGAEPYLREELFAEAQKRGRIRPEDLRAVLDAEADAEVTASGLTRRELRYRILNGGIENLSEPTLTWQVEEQKLIQSEKDRQTLAAAMELLEGFTLPQNTDRCRRFRADEVIHPLLIRLCSVYLDQGVSYWPMPDREHGFWVATRRLLSVGGIFVPKGLAGIARAAQASAECPWKSLQLSLESLGVDRGDWQQIIVDELLAMPGWAGLFHCLEKNPALAPHIVLPARLVDYLAVRFFLIALANHNGELEEVIPKPAPGPHFYSYWLFHALRNAGIDQIDSLRAAERVALRDEILALDELERRRIYHLAFERRHLESVLRPIIRHRQSGIQKPESPVLAQVFFCIDDREEAIRRHLEEVCPQVETFGAAGFFGVAMNYRGIDDARHVDLCPIVVKPQHQIHERAAAGHEQAHARRQSMRRFWANLARNSYLSSRSLVRGWISTVALGGFSVFPLVGKILTPRLFGKITRSLNDWFLPDPRTELTFMNQGKASHEAAEGLLEGFTISEKADRVAGVLSGAGLRSGFSRLVVILGHGSTSLNNPHESAYDCGACGGRKGGPNARIFAAMANHPEVRRELSERGILIPPETWFLGGYHDTCSDEIELLDLELLPAHLASDLQTLQSALDEARAHSAHERSRRFLLVAPGSPAGQLLQVQERSEHLAEPRPEYGHSTNAVSIVGRRGLTRGLFLDRRAFLVSYDATQDPEDQYLARILAAVVPVCAGINLEYYFSTVDNEVYGCGTKLPHNVTSLMGVMNGASGDLRTGLTLQMIEIHEPVRALFIIESTPERVLRVMHSNAEVKEFLENRWIRLTTVDPLSGEAFRYEHGQFLPVPAADWPLERVKRSADWYTGKSDHLPVAVVEA